MRERHAELLHVHDRTLEQDLELAECCLSLVEARVFRERPLERVRAILNRMPRALDPVTRDRVAALRERLTQLER
jgi:hypothetical protein